MVGSHRTTHRPVPLSAGQFYHDSIPGSRLEIIGNRGHRPAIEKPDEFIRVAQDYCGQDWCGWKLSAFT